MKRLPAGLDLDRLALETKAIQRKREVFDGASLLRIALVRGPGGISVRQTSAWASMLGVYPRSLIVAEFMILATSLPKSGYRAKAVLAVHRLRWQIELTFKRLKSRLLIDQLPTWTEGGSRT